MSLSQRTTITRFSLKKIFCYLYISLISFVSKEAWDIIVFAFCSAQDIILRIFRYIDDKRTECTIETKEKY